MLITEILFDLVIYALMLRLLMEWEQVSPFNRIFIRLVRITNPALVWFRRLIPRFRGVDMAGTILLLLLIFIKILALSLWNHSIPNPFGLILWVFADLLNLVFDLFFIMILAVVIFSWVRLPALYAIAEICETCTDPLLMPLRAILPSFAGLDFAPMVFMILLKLVDTFLVNKLVTIAIALSN